ncbi:30S ribosomal protein S20 [Oceanobacillus profundus]|uniref:Small ribosomal subunit protein bS20 n=1 Tax=Oceanobacillus profundus TaxID=372463 RepID=A0A417YJH4_9BACI|nr:30S ribosomal protein S20 [Oceanobacillus profundus]MBR3120197.1 30S ribosomal protein S20 [Oceanobacillus sp.]PAE31080.1 30S ribosomal protein S20 [Paenibacillus sp. 7884-2]MCM3396878.1 30S ribosomal protein S20 [Oceanobacillus profundus]MDO6448178.1 30S ribosomal protein S20 [Oceanobacillus profundus]RHW33132.1 30S ribosomal protein S20 [Oceanobacillus profundus]
MANIKSAIKRVTVNNKKRANNGPQKTEMRSEIRRVENLVEANDVENAKAALKNTVKRIDKAVQKGLIHKNAGDRQKSRLTKKVNSL